MEIPAYVKESDRVAMNEAARDYGWDWYNRGVRMVADALRDAIADGTTPTHAELVAFCDMLDEKAREPRNADDRRGHV